MYGGIKVMNGKKPPKNVGEPARVLITVEGGIADYVTDGNVEVALIDYDNEPDAKIPEEFSDLEPG